MIREEDYIMSEIPCSFLTGSAGSGKTTKIRQLIESDPSAAALCSTTGISAINLGCITINSLLGYFDSQSLKDALINGRLVRTLRKIVREYKAIAIDEISMMPGDQLDILHYAVGEANKAESKQMGIIAIGDMLQLPPVKSKWVFDSEVWPEFEKNITKLTKIWRQSDENFLNALGEIRQGNGANGVDLLVNNCGVQFYSSVDTKFQGTSILAKNDSVDGYNFTCALDVKGQEFKFNPIRKGKQQDEWSKNIPLQQRFKIGTYNMILANDTDKDEITGKPEFKFANGDSGYIRDFNKGDRSFQIELVRNKEIVSISPITRFFEVYDEPKYWDDRTFEPRRNPNTRKWIIGEITYYPLRLAYASTTFKSQGLTLDRVQIDCRHAFFGSPHQAYVALSRCKSAKGLRIVGTPELLAKRINIDERVRRFL